MEDEARKAGFTVFLCNSDRDEEKERNYIGALLSKGVDGIILLKPKSGQEDLRRLNSHIALVVEDWDYRCDQELMTVSTDGYMAVVQAMNLLFNTNIEILLLLAGLWNRLPGLAK